MRRTYIVIMAQCSASLWFHELYHRLRDRVLRYTVNLDGNICTQAKLQM